MDSTPTWQWDWAKDIQTDLTNYMVKQTGNANFALNDSLQRCVGSRNYARLG